MILWLAGSILFAGVTWGRARERRLFLAQLGSPPDEPLERLFLRLESQLGLRRPATLLLTDCAIGPAVAGTRHPVVYFPRTLADSLPAEQLEAMLAHELIHVRRKDVWVARVQFLAQVLWWFHPAVWWMNRQIDRHRERCCDEEVLATLSSSRADYARCLVDVLTAKTAFNPLPWYPGARPVEITARRLEEIMKRANMTHRKSPAWCWYAASVLALMVLPGARPSGVTDSGAAPLADAAAPPAMLEDDQPQNPQDLAQAPDSAGADKLFDAKVDSAIGKDGAGSLPWITVDADSLLELNSAADGGPQRKAQYLELGFPATSNSGTKFTPLFALQLQAPSNGILKYDDGTADGKRSFADSGEMIRFELPDGVDKIKAIRIHGSRYGYPKPPKEDFEITFVSDDFKESLSQQTAPYSLFERGEQKWVNVKFKEPLTLPKAFWIILNFNAERTKGVYVSYDTSTKGEHSRVGLPGDTEPGKTKFEGDWMIQVVTLAAK